MTNLQWGGSGAAPSTARLAALWAAVGALLLAGVTAAYIKQGPTELSVDAALEEFRRTTTTAGGADGAAGSGLTSAPAPTEGQATPGPAATGPALGTPSPGSAAAPGDGGSGQSSLTPPREGVYAQRTEGYEYTDALGGSRHDYPPETSVTVRRSGCGVVERWQPLAERYDESELCSQGDTVSIFVFRKYNEFFQRSQLLVYNCPGVPRSSTGASPSGPRGPGGATPTVPRSTPTSPWWVTKPSPSVAKPSRRCECVTTQPSPAQPGEHSCRSGSWTAPLAT